MTDEVTEEPYVMSDERLAQIRTFLDEDGYIKSGTTEADLADAVFDLLSERDDRAESDMRVLQTKLCDALLTGSDAEIAAARAALAANLQDRYR